MTTVREVLVQYMKEHGYDGLYHSEGECACLMDFPCEVWSGIPLDCELGYKVECDQSCEETPTELNFCVAKDKNKCPKEYYGKTFI